MHGKSYCFRRTTHSWSGDIQVGMRAGRGWGVSYSITRASNLRSNVLKSDPHMLDHPLQTLFCVSVRWWWWWVCLLRWCVCITPIVVAVFACYDDVFVLLWLCLAVMMGDKFSAGEVGPAQVIKSQQNSTRLIIIHSTLQCWDWL